MFYDCFHCNELTSLSLLWRQSADEGGLAGGKGKGNSSAKRKNSAKRDRSFESGEVSLF